jgi:hypothetical protein
MKNPGMLLILTDSPTAKSLIEFATLSQAEVADTEEDTS